jgi:hypothetical protein
MFPNGKLKQRVLRNRKVSRSIGATLRWGASVSQNIAGEHCWVYIEVPPGTKMEIPVQP